MAWPLSFILVALIAFVNSEVSHEETLKASLDNFSSGIYKYAAEKNVGKNMVTSPLSAQIAMALVSMGADGKTLEELQTTLMLPDKNFTKLAFKKVMSQYNDDNGVVDDQQTNKNNPQPPTLRIVNKVFVKDSPGYGLDPDYKKVAEDSFRSEVQNVDFINSDEAAKTINSWVEEKTNKRVKDLVQPDKIDSNTLMMLVNAIYFKAAWDLPFEPKVTYKDIFYLYNYGRVRTDFMRTMSEFKTVDLPDCNASAINLPFYNSNYSMILIVPRQDNGLKSVEDKMTSADLSLVLKNMSKNLVQLSIPKFKIETEIDLKDISQKMGISKAFSESAEFSGILQSHQDLYILEAKQKAFIEINEYGCEAAAASRVAWGPRAKLYDLKVNVPFYYAIIDGNGNRIFSGRLMNPTV